MRRHCQSVCERERERERLTMGKAITFCGLRDMMYMNREGEREREREIQSNGALYVFITMKNTLLLKDCRLGREREREGRERGERENGS